MNSKLITEKLPEEITKEWLDAHKEATQKLVNDAKRTFETWKIASQKYLGYRSLI
jgi:hypothetical protein